MFVRDSGEGVQPSLFPESSMELVVFWAESLYMYLLKIELRTESFGNFARKHGEDIGKVRQIYV